MALLSQGILRYHAGVRRIRSAITAPASGATPVANLYRLSHNWGEAAMTAFNVVRFRIKPGMEDAFLDAHRAVARDWPGLRHANIIKTGDGRHCIIAEWDSMEALADARPKMIASLDSFRNTLEDLGGGLGVTDPVSGSVVLELR
jgi:hypothetical protein